MVWIVLYTIMSGDSYRLTIVVDCCYWTFRESNLKILDISAKHRRYHVTLPIAYLNVIER